MGSRIQPCEALAVEDIVSQDHGHRIVSDEICADDKGLGQSVGAGLHRIAEGDAELMAVA